MAYDAATKQLILFGGSPRDSAGAVVNETWSWDGSRWTQLSPPTSPPPTRDGVLAYDPASGQLVLGGGGPSGGLFPFQTWTWDGSTWTQQSPATSPPGRAKGVLGYDPVGKGLVLFGGQGEGFYGDTWRWNGSTWTQISPATSPPARVFGFMAFDGATNQLLLTGGFADTINNAFNDLWSWTGSNWKRITPASSFTPRYDSAMGYDPADAELVLFGGGSGISTVYDETWVYTTLRVQTPSVPRGAAGVFYSTTLQAIAGQAPYTWSVSAGALPPGLTLYPGGLLKGLPTTAGRFTFTVKAVDSAGTPQSATRTLTVVINPAPKPGAWVADGGTVVRAFALNATSNSAPTTSLSGALTGLSGAAGLAFDPTGELFVANSGGASVEEFAAGSNGNVAPVRTITGPATGLNVPYGVTLDGVGDIYVADEVTNAIRVYAPTARGNAPPMRTIAGPDTGLSAPWGVTIDVGHLWVSNYGNNSLTEYAVDATGDARPMNTIAGPSTGLSQPQGLGQDGAANLLVANFFANSVLTFSPGGTLGDVAPGSTVTTAPPGTLSLPESVDVDNNDNMYVADEILGLLVVPHGASAPARAINGGASGLNGAAAVAVAPPLAITTTKMPTAALGRRYAGRLSAVLGQAPLRWRVVRGRLPRGLRLARTGTITGAPRRLGRFDFTLGVRDSGSPAQAATQRVTLLVSHAPTVQRIRARRGPTGGGRRVTITGTGFSTRRGATTIQFGRIRAIDVRCASHARCTMRTPPHGAGIVRVTVTVDGLRSSALRAVRYRYRRD
jgi:hypothetical protein